MDHIKLLSNIAFELTSVAHCRLGPEWNYKNIVSSFTRLYLITEGEGHIFFGSEKVLLKKGYLYLIPSFTHCSYLCPAYMEQYYATFSIHLPNKMSIYQLFDFKKEIKAEACHYGYFEQLCQQNRGMALPYGDPNIYQKTMDLEAFYQPSGNAQRILVRSGLLSLLLSGFIGPGKMQLDQAAHDRISASIQYIHMHLNENLSIEGLARRASMSADHFTRQFKALTSQTPLDYINRQRIQNAQLLIHTTSLSFSEIADQCGFKSNNYFCRIFRKYTKQSPKEYRNHNTLSNEVKLSKYSKG